jgi:quaternary ammonium compound-resistance protein SugE
MPWLLVILAGCFEVGMVTSLKLSEGFSKLVPSIGFLICGAISFLLLSQAIKTLPVGPAYAIWTGIGATGAVVVGVAAFGDGFSLVKGVSVALIVAGIIGLNLSGAGAH